MPLIKSASKKALQKNIKTEMDAHPSKEKRAQDLAIAYSVQRQAKKKKMAEGGMVARDQEPIKKENYKKLGTEYEGDNAEHLATGQKSYMNPGEVATKSKDWAGGKMGETPMKSAMTKPKKSEYLGPNATDGYAEGGEIHQMHPGSSRSEHQKIYDAKQQAKEEEYLKSPQGEMERQKRNKEMMKQKMAEGGMTGRPGGKSEYDGVEHPAGLEEDSQPTLSPNDYMSDEWAGGPDKDGMDKGKNPPMSEYMANHMKMLAEGGHVACMHCGGMGYDAKAEGGMMYDDVDESHDIDADSDGEGSLAEKIMMNKKWKEMGEGNSYAEGGMTEEETEHRTSDIEGPATDQSYNIKAKKYDPDDEDAEQPMDSNEHGDEREMESENKHDMVESIRKKMKSYRR